MHYEIKVHELLTIGRLKSINQKSILYIHIVTNKNRIENDK